MRLSDTMREALQELSGRGGAIERDEEGKRFVFTRTSETADARTVEALEARDLITRDGDRFAVTAGGRQVLGDEFRERRESLPVPLDWKGGTYWTRPRFAAAIGVTPTAVYMWEKGDRPIQDISWRALEWLELRLWLAYRFPAQLAAAMDVHGRFEANDPDSHPRAVVASILADAPSEVLALFDAATAQEMAAAVEMAAAGAED